MSDNLRVVCCIDEHGDTSFYADSGVDVITCCEWSADDRLYRLSPDPIPDGLLDGTIGHKDDESPAAVRAERAVREAFGQPPFDVVDTPND